jgi:hypothetical protein
MQKGNSDSTNEYATAPAMEKPLSAKVSWKAMATGFRWRENMPAPEFPSCAAALDWRDAAGAEPRR